MRMRVGNEYVLSDPRAQLVAGTFESLYIRPLPSKVLMFIHPRSRPSLHCQGNHVSRVLISQSTKDELQKHCLDLHAFNSLHLQ